MLEKEKIGKNRRRKDRKKQIIEDFKDKFNVGKEEVYESAESCNIDFYLIVLLIKRCSILMKNILKLGEELCMKL